MRIRTASSSTSRTRAPLAALALGLLALSVGCEAQAPSASAATKTAAPVALCPATMRGDGTQQFPLSGLSMMRMENDTVWKNVTHTGDADHKQWVLTRAANVRYRAICEYDEEVIGVPVDASFRRCWLVRKPGAGGVATWCES